jgi:hypothetical protein
MYTPKTVYSAYFYYANKYGILFLLEGGREGIHVTLKRYLFCKTIWPKITVDGNPYKFMQRSL